MLTEQTFEEAVIQEVHLLQDQLPEWRPTGPYADHLRPLESLERREADRLDRLLRRERAAWGERTRERVMRERKSPWSEEERWTLRKRVWRERRDRERELLEQRERELLDREQQLQRLQGRFENWLNELEQLEPQARDWCDNLAKLGAAQGLTPGLLDQLHLRRTQAAERHARQLLTHDEVRRELVLAARAAPHDPVTIARAIAPALGPQTLASLGSLGLPVVVAALALLAAREEAN